MKRQLKQTVETTPARILEPPPESAMPNHAHPLVEVLEAKRQQFYEQYAQLLAVKGWNASHELSACEKALALYLGVSHALLFCTEAAAFQLLLEALALSCYDRLYLPENFAHHLYSVAVKAPATVHLVSLEPVSRRMDLTSLTTVLRPRTTRGRDVIIVSHVAGGVFPVDELEQRICNPETIIIEDATEAFGAKELSGTLVGSSHRSRATLCGFSAGSSLDVGGAGAITTRDGQLEKWLHEQQERFALSFPQTALLSHSFKNAPQLLQARRDLLTRYLTALREAFHGLPKDREPCLAESLLDEHAAPSALLLRVDCVHLGTRKERIVALFSKAGLSADWGSSSQEKKEVEQEEEARPSSCFTSLRLKLDPSFSQSELVAVFRSLRDVLTRS